MIDTILEALIPLHILSTAYMMGLIWFVQLVHYPIFTEITPESFGAFERRHQRLTSFAVVPAMLTELATGVLIRIYINPGLLFDLSLLILAIIWISTFLLQVPIHAKLEKLYSSQAIKKLVLTNWIRTIGWSLRSAALIFMIFPSIYG